MNKKIIAMELGFNNKNSIEICAFIPLGMSRSVEKTYNINIENGRNIGL
jgi:hypothetical protein